MRVYRTAKGLIAVSVTAAALLTSSCSLSDQTRHHVSGDADAGQKPGRDEKFKPETPNNARFSKLKAVANGKAPQAAPPPSPTASVPPTVLLNQPGAHDAAGWYPTDANGARGAKNYVEVINNTVGFFSGSLNLQSSNTTFALAATTSGYVGDPEMIYDPGSKKFFYTMIDQDAAGNWRLDFGYSKTSNPLSVSDFCHYQMPSSGTTLPDYPRLGASKNFLLIGTNNYANASNYIGSSVYWAAKPPAAALTSCPATPKNGSQTGFLFTPVPAHQTDPSTTGFILASSWSGGSSLTKYAVTKDATTGNAVFSAPTSVPVATYSMPADADQPGTTDQLATNDNRLYQVVQSFDPATGVPVLWTSHTIFGGNGAAARWYEMNTNGSMLQSGTIADPTLDYYYPTIASDRAYHSASAKAYGQNMVIGFNQSSTNSSVGIDVASERGTTGLSPVVIATPGDGTAITCGGTCRWGDRSSASAGLSASLTLPTGRVWLSQSIVTNGRYYTRNLQVSP